MSRETASKDPVNVWIRPNGLSWKISVDSGAGAKWLIQRLQGEGFETAGLTQSEDDWHCTFRCSTSTVHERDYVENLLIRWPEVHLQHSPEYKSALHVVPPASPLLAKPLDRAVEPTNATADVEPFRVWVRPLGNAWKLQAEGFDGTEWLRRELIHRGLSCTDAVETAPSTMYQFRCMSENVRQSNYVWNLLKALPEVLLQNAPA